MIWKCPRCLGALTATDRDVRCTVCPGRYELISGIPDFRLTSVSGTGHEADNAQARRIAGAAECELAGLVRAVFAAQADSGEARVAYRTQQVMSDPQRLRSDVAGWLRPCVSGQPPFLDLGCGAGTLLAACAAEGYAGAGVDLSMTWLVIAQRLIAAWGGKPVLAAASAEALPLADESVSGVVSLDVIEHVSNPAIYLRSIDRVLNRGGYAAFSTPNRYSLAAEPHVFVWGVGWVPRALQKKYVKLCSGKDYDNTRLLSRRELAKLLATETRLKFRVMAPPVPDREISGFSRSKAALARIYNRLVSVRTTQWLFLMAGAFFHVIGRKDEPIEAIDRRQKV